MIVGFIVDPLGESAAKNDERRQAEAKQRQKERQLKSFENVAIMAAKAAVQDHITTSDAERFPDLQTVRYAERRYFVSGNVTFENADGVIAKLPFGAAVSLYQSDFETHCYFVGTDITGTPPVWLNDAHTRLFSK